MARPVDPERRRELLDAATQFVIEHGLASTALRPLGEALGVQAPTLLHHFGSKEALVSQILNEVRRRLQDVAAEAMADSGAPTMAVWHWGAAPEHENLYRTFFEIYGVALRKPEQYREFLDHVVDDWLDAGHTAEDDIRTTVTIALMRGLLLDLLTTGDRPRVQEAFEAVAPWLSEATGPLR